MSEKTSFTSREAVLSSLLLHACVIIVVLLFPGVFAPAPPSPRVIDPNAPIPMTFVEDSERPPEPVVHLGDKGDRTVSDPRPETAPPPENDDPFAIGNTPNRFAGPPVQRPAAPTPPVPASSPGREPDASGEGDDAADPSGLEGGATGEDERTASADSFLIPPTPADRRPAAQEGGRRGASLKDTLGRMSMGMSGGDPLRFNNPVGAVSGPFGGLSFDTPGYDWGPYARKIYWVIWTNWTQGWPPAAWAGMKGVVTVHFRIWRDGRITDITIEDPSGTPAFDTCASVALEASSPLPPLPSDFPGESEGITARFLYNMNSAER